MCDDDVCVRARGVCVGCVWVGGWVGVGWGVEISGACVWRRGGRRDYGAESSWGGRPVGCGVGMRAVGL